MKVQNFPRHTLPYVGYFQPYCAYYALFMTFIMSWIIGYTVFLPGNWDSTTFAFAYIVLILPPFVFTAWKVCKKTRWVRSTEMKFFEKERMEIDEYEREFKEREENPSGRFGRFWALLLG